MKHFLTAGFFDPLAVRECRVVARGERLPERVLAELLARYRDPDRDAVVFEGTAVEVHDGWVRCSWYAPRFIERSVQFVLALRSATGCLIADVEHGRVLGDAELRALV